LTPRLTSRIVLRTRLLPALGVRVVAAQNGTVTGLRFYRFTA